MNDFWITGASVLNVDTGEFMDEAVHIIDGKISRIGGLPQDTDRVVHYNGKYIIPGLIDAHVHILGLNTIPPYAQVIRAVDYLKAHLRSGVVMVRDVGTLTPDGGDTSSIELARAVKDGTARACCEVMTSGRMLSPTYGRHDIGSGPGLNRSIADTDDEIIRFIRYQKMLGADLIKVMATGSGHDAHANLSFYPLEQMMLIVKEAHRIGMKVAAHAVAPYGTEVCIDAGVDSVEHAPVISPAYMDKMIRKNIFYVPTMCVYRHLAATMEGEGGAQSRRTVDNHNTTVPEAYGAGVKLVTGSDNPGPCNFGGEAPQVLNEMLIMKELGVQPIDCIRAATINAASLLGVDYRLGSLEEEKDADFIVINGNPLENLTAVDDIVQVYKSGQPVR